MKTKIFFVLLLTAFLCNTANAQQIESFVIQDTSIGLVKDSKIRYVNDSVAIGYFYKSHNGYFLRIDLKNAMITHKVMINIESLQINDFRIMDDTVYACGSRLISPYWKGVIVKFPVESIVDTKATYKYIDVENTTSLTRMVAYKNSAIGGNEIVAIGYKEISIEPYLHRYGRIVDCKSFSQAYYKVRDNYDSGTQLELYDDIVLTNNYIGIVGSLDNNTSCIRRTPRFNTNIMSGMIDTIYTYSYSHSEPGSKQHATELGTDSMATACYAINSYNQNKTHIRRFNLQTMLMLDGYSLPLNSKSEPEELVYNDSLRTYLLLQYLPLLGSQTHYEYQIVTQLTSGPFMVSTYYVHGQGFSSIASSKQSPSFIMVGGTVFTKKKTLNIPQGSCYETSSIWGKTLQTVAYSIIYDNAQVEYYSTNWIQLAFDPYSPQVKKLCLNLE